MKTILSIFFLFLTSICIAQKVNKYEKIEDSLMALGQTDKLMHFFEKKLQANPRDESALRGLGYLSINSKNLVAGEKYYTQAIAIDPTCGNCYFNLAEIASIQKDNTRASSLIEKGISFDPKNSLLYATRGQLEEKSGQIHLAEFDYTKAIELAPENDMDYYVTRGGFYTRQKKYAQAINDFSHAIDIAPGNYYAYFQRANIYNESQDFTKALADINKAIELDSTKMELYLARASIYDNMKDFNSAILDYATILQHNPSDVNVYNLRARSKYNNENMDGACVDFLKVLQIVQEQHIQDPDAIQDVQIVVDNICDTTRASYFFQRGIAFYNLKEYHKAIDIYTIGLNKFPQHALMLSFRGNAYLAINDFVRSKKDYTDALDRQNKLETEIKEDPSFAHSETKKNIYLKGTLAEIHESIAEDYFGLGLYDNALAEINTAISLVPAIPGFYKEDYYNLRGCIFLALTQYPAAIIDFTTSIQLNGNIVHAYFNRSVAKISMGANIKITTFSFSGGVNNQPIIPNWNIPIKISVDKSNENVLSALADCDMTITIDPKYANGYYLRGIIKKLLGYPDYCSDTRMAKNLGYPIDQVTLIDCNIH